MAYALRNFWVQVVDEIGNPWTSGITVSVGTTTIYSDSNQTAKTNPITIGANGVASWWQAAASVVVTATNDEGGTSGTVTMASSTASHRIVVPRHTLNPLEGAMPQVDFFDDFLGGYVSGDRWTLATDAGGTMTIDDARDGIGLLLSGATDNDGSTLSSTDELFLADTDKNFFFEARVYLEEQNTDDANIYVGLGDIVTVDLMQDNGGGPAATLDGIGFYKLDGNLYWEFETSNGATTDEVNSDMVAFVSKTWYRLGFKYNYNDGVTAKVTPYVNGTAYAPLDLVISGMLEMNVALCVKAGGANAETLKIDYVRCVADRDD